MEFSTVIKERRTVRRFSQKPVSDAEIRQLIDAARLSSCARNSQRLRYVVARSPEINDRIFPHTAWAGSVKPHRTPTAGVDAPTAYIAVIAPASECGDTMLFADSGAAIQSIQLAAWDMGIGCCWLGAINRPAISEVLALPDSMSLLYLVALGYAGEKPVYDDVECADSVKYYLDDNDLLHIPKLTVDAITQWL